MTTSFRTDSSGNTGAISFKATDLIQLATPGATLLGAPKAPTPVAGDNTTNIATTAFVTNAVNTVSGNNATPSNALPLADGTSAAAGSSAQYSRGDHVHPQFTSASNTTPLAPAASGVVGVSPNFARADHVHPQQNISVPVGSNVTPQPLGVAAAGVSADFSRADHVHASQTIPVASSANPLADAAAAAPGTAATFARGDHVHPQFTSPSSVTPALPTVAGAVGSSNNFARADHAHPAGMQSLTSNGYATLPGGLILQWGFNTFAAAGSAISFPIPFPNAVFSITATPATTGAIDPPAVSGQTVSGFTGKTTGNLGCFWMATGR